MQRKRAATVTSQSFCSSHVSLVAQSAFLTTSAHACSVICFFSAQLCCIFSMARMSGMCRATAFLSTGAVGCSPYFSHAGAFACSFSSAASAAPSPPKRPLVMAAPFLRKTATLLALGAACCCCLLCRWLSWQLALAPCPRCCLLSAVLAAGAARCCWLPLCCLLLLLLALATFVAAGAACFRCFCLLSVLLSSPAACFCPLARCRAAP